MIPAKVSSDAAFRGLKAVIYADAEAPTPPLRTALKSFAESGGLLITGPKWGTVAGTKSLSGQHPRYTVMSLGKGRLAVSKDAFEDPYMVANDSVVLTSHRCDLLRFWNGGAFNAQKTTAPDGKRALIQMVFYAGARNGDPTLWVAGLYRSAQLWTLDASEPRDTAVHPAKDGVEVRLPPAGPYVAVELEIA